MSICKILGVPFQNITPGDAEERIVKFLHQSGKAMVFTPNPEMVMAAQKDEEFMKILNESAMNILISPQKQSAAPTGILRPRRQPRKLIIII